MNGIRKYIKSIGKYPIIYGLLFSLALIVGKRVYYQHDLFISSNIDFLTLSIPVIVAEILSAITIITNAIQIR